MIEEISSKMSLENYKKIHFIGIGGIGISAIARMFLLQGKEVTGSDLSSSRITDKLKNEGANIAIGPHTEENLSSDVDLVVYTVAMLELDPHNPEYEKAKKNTITTLSYPEALGVLTEEKKTVAVAGTHGKTTTTAMIAEILIKAGIDPTVVVGSVLNKQKENFISGKSDVMVVEACEYCDSFLNIHPFVGVITNIDADHLDYFGSITKIQESFRKFAERIPKEGTLICNPNDGKVMPILSGLECAIVDYTKVSHDAQLKVPGEHNKQNAQAARAVAHVFGVSEKDSKVFVEEFAGTWRRQEFKGVTEGGAFIYDDYAHHPREIKMTLEGFQKQFPEKRITVVFQPHLYSRTKLLFDDFVSVLSGADSILLADIYGARENPDPSISSEKLAQSIAARNTNVETVSSFEEIVSMLSLRNENNLILTMGAGDIYKVAEALIKH